MSLGTKNIQIFSDEERANPSKVFEREDLNNSEISVYYGSEKSDLVNICNDCDKKQACKHYKEAVYNNFMLRTFLYNPKIVEDLGISDKDRKKLLNNVYIIIHCKIKEVK